MNIRFSYDQRFEKLIETIRTKYGDDILTFSGVHPKQLDMAEFTRSFLFNGHGDACTADLSVDANANVDDRSVVSFDYEVSKALSKLNALHIIWTYIIKTMKEAGESASEINKTANTCIENIITCALYLNDAHYTHKAYCYAFDLMPLVMEGMPFVKKIYIGPPKHFTSMINLVVQAVAFISNQIAGAASLPNLFIYLDYFARKDFGTRYWENPETLEIIRQGLQNLVYSLNFSFRGSQSAFTNVSLYDRVFLRELFANTVMPDGSKADLDSVLKLQEIFAYWYNEESMKQSFTFPVLTANLAVDDDRNILDDEFLRFVSEINLPYGMYNIYTGPPTCLSSCCRLRSDISRAYTNSLGTGSVSIGSHRVCTINLPRIAIESGGDPKTFALILAQRIKQSHAVLNAHRAILKDIMNNGRLPLYSYNWMHLEKQYSTIGLLGVYEATTFMGEDIHTKQGEDFVRSILDAINIMNKEEEKRFSDGRLFNLELIPGEQAASKLCEADKMLFPSFTNKYYLYSNQFVPLIEKSSIIERIRLQGLFDSEAQGGCILHLNIDHKIPTPIQMKALIQHAAKMGVVYFAVNYNIATCTNNHRTIGKTHVCPVCNAQIVANRTRVVGFVTEVSDWSMVRRVEHSQRVFYTPEELVESSPSETEEVSDLPLAIVG